MVTGKRRRGAGWQHLIDAAGSADKEDRLVALVRAYSWVEHALDAAEAPGPRRPIARRILRSFSNAALIQGLRATAVRRAIGIRHQATHEGTVPDRAACVDAVEAFQDVWHALSRHFVNVTNAAALGRRILSREGVLAVCIYGSLARASVESNDIDYLVLDDGTYSSDIEIGRYEDGTFNAVRTTKEALEILGIASNKLKRCAECRWLDIMLIDGELFGSDAEYTSNVRTAQPDPWFFVNIARDLKELDLETGNFKVAGRSPFKELRLSQADLAKIGLAEHPS